MERAGKMTGFRLPVLIFLLVFLSGTGFVLWLRTPGKSRKIPADPPKTEAVNRKLPPLKIPDEKKRAARSESWEFTGETNTNFVTASAKIEAELMHQGWRREKRIPLDESIAPQVIRTFRRGELELTLMLWKIDNGITGFAYKREKIVNPGVNMQ